MQADSEHRDEDVSQMIDTIRTFLVYANNEETRKFMTYKLCWTVAWRES